jgi:hypothetical protein
VFIQTSLIVFYIHRLVSHTIALSVTILAGEGNAHIACHRLLLVSQAGRSSRGQEVESSHDRKKEQDSEESPMLLLTHIIATPI